MACARSGAVAFGRPVPRANDRKQTLDVPELIRVDAATISFKEREAGQVFYLKILQFIKPK